MEFGDKQHTRQLRDISRAMKPRPVHAIHHPGADRTLCMRNASFKGVCVSVGTAITCRDCLRIQAEDRPTFTTSQSAQPRPPPGLRADATVSRLPTGENKGATFPTSYREALARVQAAIGDAFDDLDPDDRYTLLCWGFLEPLLVQAIKDAEVSHAR
jgi:hypothetical protein